MSGSSQDPSPLPQVVSKDILLDHSKSSWMRLYVPTTALNGGVASKKLPLVVYFNGGGFTSRSAVESEIFTLVVGGIAREINVVVASPSYRLNPENKLPAAYEDGVEAVEWLRNKSEEDEWLKSYADLSNVFLMGTGTGGNVAYNVGLRFTEKDLTPLSIRGLILESPLFSGEELFPSNMKKIGRLEWKVMVTGVRGDPLMDSQRDVAKLMKEKGVDVVERFDGGDLFTSVRSFIYSSAP
ncbi:unnamed protein product [Eruca vesicaria subsp. sativa]|uniref:Alpha/beta hydrolase fold-3 domain-containing protein n=1 Tax=Eruca vesicaria subsp. sativa TaxID=29727 RepID=A0ABC8L1K3_ERUVS|nr:unnamed protein product [Eruca vesicaria subsp. sativa]